MSLHTMRANVKFFFISFIFFVLQSSAQSSNNDSAATKIILPNAGILFNWESNSTAFTTNFLLEVNNGVLSQTAKENSQKKLNKTNYFVNRLEGGAYYVLPLKSADAGLIITLGAGSYADASFSKDAFELILNGNAHYKNETKNIGALSYRSIVYQSAGVGIRKYFKNKTQCINATLNFIAGDATDLITVTKGSVFTEENGEYVDVNVAADWHYNAEGAKLLNPKGYGAALNFNWMKIFEKNHATLSIGLKDFGIVHYGSSSVYKSIDTSVHLTGINIGAITATTVLHDFNFQDSLQENFNIKTGQKAFNFIMPAVVEIMYQQDLSKKSILLLQGNIYFKNALPMVKAAYLYAVKPNFYIGAAISAGGYSKTDIDLLARYKTKKIILGAAVRSVEGLISPSHASGVGAYLNLGLFLD